jgi:hypothetical protein
MIQELFATVIFPLSTSKANAGTGRILTLPAPTTSNQQQFCRLQIF